MTAVLVHHTMQLEKVEKIQAARDKKVTGEHAEDLHNSRIDSLATVTNTKDDSKEELQPYSGHHQNYQSLNKGRGEPSRRNLYYRLYWLSKKVQPSNLKYENKNENEKDLSIALDDNVDVSIKIKNDKEQLMLHYEGQKNKNKVVVPMIIAIPART